MNELDTGRDPVRIAKHRVADSVSRRGPSGQVALHRVTPETSQLTQLRRSFDTLGGYGQPESMSGFNHPAHEVLVGSRRIETVDKVLVDLHR